MTTFFRHLRDRGSIATLLLLVGFASPAAAFELTGSHWELNRVDYWVNPNFPDGALSGDRDTQLEIIRCGADAWRDQTDGDWLFNYRGSTSRSGFVLGDQRNAISFVDVDGNMALAATVVDFFEGSGRAVHFDIVYFGSTLGAPNRWNGPRDPTSGTVDILGVAVHEFGHALGLDHSAVQASTMYSRVQGRGRPLRTLHEDDKDGLLFLYDRRAEFDTGPTLFSATPEFGPLAGGNEVTLAGRNFTWTADTSLRVGSTLLSQSDFNVDHCGRVRILSMPANDAGPVSIRVLNELGGMTLENAYRYGSRGPALAHVEPAEGPVTGGISVTIVGENFASGAMVRFGAAPLEDLVVVDERTIEGTLPAFPMAATVDVILEQGDDVETLVEGFTYRSKVLEIVEGTGVPGSSGNRISVLASSDEDVSGVSFGIRWDTTVAELADITVVGTASEDASFASGNIDNVLGEANYGIVYTFVGDGPHLPAGTRQTVAFLEVDVPDAASVGAATAFRIEASVGQPPVNTLFTTASAPAGSMPLGIVGAFTVAESSLFIRGDSDQTGFVDLTDAVVLLDALFRGGAQITCLDSADSNDDGNLDLSDAVYILLYLFGGGDAPPAPFPEPGLDPTADGLDC